MSSTPLVKSMPDARRRRAGFDLLSRFRRKFTEQCAKPGPWLLGGILLVSCFMMPILYGEGPLSQQSSMPDTAIPEVSEIPEETTPEVDSAVQVAQQEIRDPFELPSADAMSAHSGSAADMRVPDIKTELQGIGFGGRDAYAVIGGEIFYEGDDKNGIKLLEVRRGEVDILINGGKVTVSLFPAEDLQKSKDRAQKKNAAGVSSADQGPVSPGSSPQKEQAPS